jgi:hypothetical protein
LLFNSVTANSLSKMKPIISKLIHQLFPLISLKPSTNLPIYTSLNLLLCTATVNHSSGLPL